MSRFVLVLTACLTLVGSLTADELRYKDVLVQQLANRVPGILKTLDPESGRFGSGIWICRDQHPMYPLAVAYSVQSGQNPYYKDQELLNVIIKSADPLIENMDEQGRWVFAKKDGSTWGMIWMPWTYSRWIRTFALIEKDMPQEDRERWEQALTLGYTGISKHCLGSVHNIPAHHAMGLYLAGQVLKRPEWSRQAAEFLGKVASHQSAAGYWSEGGGPVVLYNFVYVDAIGTYYAMSGDADVLPALEKAALFHRHFTYPNGRNVETVDQRNPYHDTVSTGNVGFTFSAAGRTYLKRQWDHIGMDHLDPDLMASLILYGEEGLLESAEEGAEEEFVLREEGEERAMTLRRGPWFICLSAYTSPVSTSRWIQDRQNLMSIFHDRVGLIIGGGNTKLQPAWSNFTVGNMDLLKHTPGETKPNFLPQGDLIHVPEKATLLRTPMPGLALDYGSESCRIEVNVVNDSSLEIRLETTTRSELPVLAHLTLLPHLNEKLILGKEREVILTEEPLHVSAAELQGQLSFAGYRLRLPESAELHWPALPHNPYRKDGRATAEEGRIEIRIPFDSEHAGRCVLLEVSGR